MRSTLVSISLTSVVFTSQYNLRESSSAVGADSRLERHPAIDLCEVGPVARCGDPPQVTRAHEKYVAGGKLDAFYFTFGKTDFLLIADLPDSVSSAALSLAVNASGVTRVTTTPIITPEEMDAAAKKQIGYRGPGQ